MSKCLIVIDHSFRTNSLLFYKALNSYNNVCVVHVSNYYLDEKFKSFYGMSNNEYYYKVLDDFASQIKKKYDLNLKTLKTPSAVSVIEEFCKKENVEKVFYDKPLFSERLVFNNLDVEEVDSDSFIDSCTKMTAKSRWIYWAKNKFADNDIYCSYRKVNDFGSIGSVHIVNKENAEEIRQEVVNAYSHFKEKLMTYHVTRNEREGSTKLSKFFHHGLIDARVITYLTLAVSPHYIEKDFPTVPLLRQLAFREISIRKCREKSIGLLDCVKETAELLLDDKSFSNLRDNEFDAVFTKDQFMNGNTGFELLDREIKLCIQNRWMPNRLRMWLSGECYWGLGGGFKSLEALIEFFNLYSEDGQSPNNIVSCIGCMRMSYGKVMKYNKERTFRLIEGKEVIK